MLNRSGAHGTQIRQIEADTCHDIFKLFRALFTTYVVHTLCLSHIQ